MHETRPAKITSPIVDLGGAHVKLLPLALIVGAIGIAVAFFRFVPGIMASKGFPTSI